MSVFEELKRRNVFRVGLAYLVLGWVVIQVTDIVAPALQLPDWTLRLVLWIGAIAFPFVLFLAWAFEITPEGIQRESDIDRNHSITTQTGHRLDLVTIALVVIAVGIVLLDRWSQPEADATTEQAMEAAPTEPTGPAETDALPPVVAVLPFLATGSDDGGFLAVGLHDDLLTQLARLEAFKVISRTSMMEYAGTTKNIRQIGEELGAGYILEGGVQARGNRVRINAQLIDARADEHLWAETYDRELTAENLFDVQSELAASIARETHVSLGDADQEMLREVPTQNLEAYNSYLRGLELRDRGGFNIDDTSATSAAFRKAVQLDPAFAEAWAHLSISSSRLYQITQDDAYKREAAEAQTQAESLQPTLPDAELARVVFLYRVEREYDQALARLEALQQRSELNGWAFVLKSWLLKRAGRFEDAYQARVEASRLDPRSVEVVEGLVSLAAMSRECELAASHARAALALYPDHPGVRSAIAEYELGCTGNAQRASEILEGIAFSEEENYMLFVAKRAAMHERNWDRLLKLANTQSSRPGPLGRGSDALWQTEALRYLEKPAAAEERLEEAGRQLDLAASDQEIESTILYAALRAIYYSFRGDADATVRWIGEHRERVRQQLKGDRLDEQLYDYLYAELLTRVGRLDAAVELLDKLLAIEGPYTLVYFENDPILDRLRELPAYQRLTEKYPPW